MADVVDTINVFSGTRKRTYRFTNRSDGTGEATVTKINVSTLTGPTGAPASKLAIEEIWWNIQGFTSVQLNWDATTDDEALILSGNGYKNFVDQGGLVDPWSTGHNGNLLLTTYGAAAAATYDILITVRLK